MKFPEHEWIQKRIEEVYELEKRLEEAAKEFENGEFYNPFLPKKSYSIEFAIGSDYYLLIADNKENLADLLGYVINIRDNVDREYEKLLDISNISLN